MTISMGQISTNQTLTADAVIRITTNWPDLRVTPLESQDQADLIRRDLALISAPCDHTWLMARIGSLLHPYYAGRAPKAMIEMMAEDWSEALKGFPQWAVTSAVRWWKSAENPDRKRKPVEGDIEARCNFEMGVVRLAEGAIDRYDRGVSFAKITHVRELPTPEQTAERKAAAQEILKDFGFGNRAN